MDSRDSVLWAEDGALVAYGVDGIVAVRVAGVTLVTTVARAATLKELLNGLPADLTGERGI